MLPCTEEEVEALFYFISNLYLTLYPIRTLSTPFPNFTAVHGVGVAQAKPACKHTIATRKCYQYNTNNSLKTRWQAAWFPEHKYAHRTEFQWWFAFQSNRFISLLTDTPQFCGANPYFFSENLYQSVSFIYASMYSENVHAIHIAMQFTKKSRHCVIKIDSQQQRTKIGALLQVARQ